jgi:hypothetical protein
MHKSLASLAILILGLVSCVSGPPPAPEATPTQAVVPTFTATLEPSPTIISPTSTPLFEQPPADFAFQFEFGACNTDILDTFENTFTKDMILAEDPDVTIPLPLTDEEMGIIFEEMVFIDFWDYPEQFSIPIPEEGLVQQIEPSSTYRFTVRSGGETKVVEWNDEIVSPSTVEADNLRALIGVIRQILESRPEIQGLPEPNAACA